MKLAILSGFHTWEDSYRMACEELHVDYIIVDIRSSAWMDNVKHVVKEVDGFIASPPCNYQEWKTIYDERLFFIDRYFQKPLFPNYNSCYIYESKRNMAAFLEYYQFPHAKTRVFTQKQEALGYLKEANYPIVAKANIGAGGQAVYIVRGSNEARKIVQHSFGNHNGSFCLGQMPWAKSGLGLPFPLYGKSQRHFVIFQDFYKIKWEWRVLKIGSSYFGHQKLLKGDKASGSGLVGWVMPPQEVLELAKDVCDKGGFDVMDVDIFETIDGKLLINELQSQFGSYLDYQMMVDGKPGRMKYDEEVGFVFEEGIFNRLNSKLLVVEEFVSKLSQKEVESDVC